MSEFEGVRLALLGCDERSGLITTLHKGLQRYVQRSEHDVYIVILSEAGSAQPKDLLSKSPYHSQGKQVFDSAALRSG